MRLIDADALMLDIIEAGQANKGGRYKVGDFWELNGAEIRAVVDAQPTVDAVPVRHGKWIESDEYDEYRGRLYRCSNCNTFVISDMDNYCPFCGAKMGADHDS